MSSIVSLQYENGYCFKNMHLYIAFNMLFIQSFLLELNSPDFYLSCAIINICTMQTRIFKILKQ